ncbi:MAG: hypothetical protein ACYDH5_10310 [Acidimicrobiales bacterium]
MAALPDRGGKRHRRRERAQHGPVRNLMTTMAGPTLSRPGSRTSQASATTRLASPPATTTTKADLARRAASRSGGAKARNPPAPPPPRRSGCVEVAGKPIGAGGATALLDVA